jgi:hypothetical protein
VWKYAKTDLLSDISFLCEFLFHKYFLLAHIWFRKCKISRKFLRYYKNSPVFGENRRIFHNNPDSPIFPMSFPYPENVFANISAERCFFAINYQFIFPTSFCHNGFLSKKGEKIFSHLKVPGNKADFLGFLQKLVPHESLTLPFGPFRFWLRIRGDIHIRKTTRRYHRYGESPTPVSLSRGVDDSPHHWNTESATPRITDMESRLLNFLKENSLYRWYGESSTPRTSDTVSRRLPVSLSRRVADSAYHRYGESTTPRIVESGSRRLRVSMKRGVAIRKKN